MTEQLALFNFAPQQVIKTVHDPYWDEIVLAPGAAEETGQLSLLYDDSAEPPDPDDYPSQDAYSQAWDEWEERNPVLATEVRVMSDEESDRNHTILEYKGFVGELFIKESTAQVRITRNGKLCLTAENTVTGENARNWFYQEVEDLISHGVGAQVRSDTQKTAPEHTLLVREQSDTSDVLNPYNCVREQVFDDTCNTVREQNVAPEHTHWLEEYWVQRREQKYEYYRYCWMEGRKIHHIHIGGGNVRSPIAQRKKAAVEIAIAFGLSPGEIEKLIRQKSGVGSRE